MDLGPEARRNKIIKRSDRTKGFVVLPRCWVVERTFAWLNRTEGNVKRTNRRLAKDFEACVETTTAWLFAANVKLLIRRMARI